MERSNQVECAIEDQVLAAHVLVDPCACLRLQHRCRLGRPRSSARRQSSGHRCLRGRGRWRRVSDRSLKLAENRCVFTARRWVSAEKLQGPRTLIGRCDLVSLNVNPEVRFTPAGREPGLILAPEGVIRRSSTVLPNRIGGNTCPVDAGRDVHQAQDRGEVIHVRCRNGACLGAGDCASDEVNLVRPARDCGLVVLVPAPSRPVVMVEVHRSGDPCDPRDGPYNTSLLLLHSPLPGQQELALRGVPSVKQGRQNAVAHARTGDRNASSYGVNLEPTTNACPRAYVAGE